jgi:ribosomal protein S18 acetylase RimI-like enzyme
MSYLAAVEHAMKEKEKVADTQGVIDILWQDKKAQLVNGFGERYEARFTRIGEYLDITLSQESIPVGFVTLISENDGKYSIVNDSNTSPHPAVTNTPGHGLAVREEFRKRGLGSALLSLGIGIAQKDFKEKGEVGEFKILATDVTESGLGCYKNFGFQIKEGMTVTEGYYLDKDHVPGIKILRGKASFWGRLKKRLSV